MSDLRWQPIDTAPKDGSNLLVNDLDLGPVVGTWSDYGQEWQLAGTTSRVYPDQWMPLPDPPKYPPLALQGQGNS